MKLPEEPETPFVINLVPMIDVIFAILTFFVFSSVFLTRSEGLDVNLPQAATSKLQQTQQINVSITADGAIALNRKPISLPNLVNAVTQLSQKQEQSLVIINADRQVNHGRVVEVMDQLRQIKGVKLAIATEKS